METNISFGGTDGSSTVSDSNVRGATNPVINVHNQFNQLNQKPEATESSQGAHPEKDQQGQEAIEISKEVPGPEAMDIIAKHIGNDWKRLGEALGLSRDELDLIKIDNNIYGQREVNHEMLRRWKQQADQLELGTLALKCKEIGRRDISGMLAKMRDA